MNAASLGFGYLTARIAVPVLTLGRMRVQNPHEDLKHGKGNKLILAKGGSAVFGAFLFAAVITGFAILVTGGQL
jgi:hypothetical protein